MGRKSTFATNVAHKQYKIIHHPILTGNITPHDWYEKFTNNRGRPDLSLISVLAEIVYWYRPKKVKDNQTGDITYVKSLVIFSIFRRQTGQLRFCLKMALAHG